MYRQIIFTIFLFALTIILGWFIPMPWNWFIIAALMVVFLGAIGWWTKRRLGGILIEERNKMSLSRFQMVAWTVLLLSAWMAIVLQRIRGGEPNSVDVGLPPLLWALMGISTTSLVGSPLIKDSKRDRAPTDEAVRLAASKLLPKEDFERLANEERQAAERVTLQSQVAELAVQRSQAALLSAQLAVPLAQAAPQTLVDPLAKTAATAADDALRAQLQLKDAREAHLEAQQRISEKVDEQRDGVLCVNPRYEDATFTDLFTGEEINNCGRPELGKVQMFYFTLAAVVTYGVALFKLMAANAAVPTTLIEFPPLSEGLVALLAISHAGYLANKAVDHTQTEPNS